MVQLADGGDVDTDGSTLGYVRDVIVSVLKGEFIEFGAPMWIFVGILGAFLVTRGITRFIRRRAALGGKQSGPIKDITVGGVHIHHQVFGIVMMFVFGLLMVAINPLDVQLNVFAVGFGIGVGLAFDEFALWLHLDDVYWSQLGRKSIDAVAIVLVLTASTRALLDLLDLSEESASAGDLAWLIWLYVLATVVPAIICLLKGKVPTAALAVVYQPIGLIGAFRLGKPDSFWARHFYGPDSRRRARALHRFGADYQARLDRLRDLVGGFRPHRNGPPDEGTGVHEPPPATIPNPPDGTEPAG